MSFDAFYFKIVTIKYNVDKHGKETGQTNKQLN